MKKYILTTFGDAVIREDGAIIPFADGNTDYQQYLTWLAEGNTPEPADPASVETPVDPVAKLQAFLAANPDVQALL